MGRFQGIVRSPNFAPGEEGRVEIEPQEPEFSRERRCEASCRPLCFNTRSHQQTHPWKAKKGHKDADATLSSPMLLGVADGVSQLEDFGIDASLLPNELLSMCAKIAQRQLIPGCKVLPQDAYCGPIHMLRQAFEMTECLGSLTVVLAIMDNSSRIQGKPQPTVSIITLGDCGLLVLRRARGQKAPLQVICRTNPQRINGESQTPLQLARVDARIDPDFDDVTMIKMIEMGSAVRCVPACEGDIIVVGSDGVFDNLFPEEITELCNSALRPGEPSPVQERVLAHLARSIVRACHAKTRARPDGQLPQAPIGEGGKGDDTSVVVAEVVEWTDDGHDRPPSAERQQRPWREALRGVLPFGRCCNAAAGYDAHDECHPIPAPAGARALPEVMVPQHQVFSWLPDDPLLYEPCGPGKLRL